MLTGACIGFIATYASDDHIVGIVAALSAGVPFHLLLGFYVVTLGANQVAVGIAIKLLAAGVTAFLYRLIFGSGTQSVRIDVFSQLNFGRLAEIPFIGPLLFRQDPFAYLALALIPLAWFTIAKTRFGLNV